MGTLSGVLGSPTMPPAQALGESRALRRLVRPILRGPQLNHLMRVAPVVALVNECEVGDLLDVGSGSVGIRPWTGSGWRVTTLDIDFEDYGAATGPGAGNERAIVGDVRDLPFSDRTFDVVVAIDLLEHVAPDDRPRALREMVRVTRRRLIVACPTGAASLAADADLAKRLRFVPAWIEEHLDQGFPEASEVAAALEPHGHLATQCHEALTAHERIVRAELSVAALVPLRVAAAAISSALRAGGRRADWARRTLTRLRGRDAQPAYRTIFTLDREMRCE